MKKPEQDFQFVVVGEYDPIFIIIYLLDMYIEKTVISKISENNF